MLSPKGGKLSSDIVDFLLYKTHHFNIKKKSASIEPMLTLN